MKETIPEHSTIYYFRNGKTQSETVPCNVMGTEFKYQKGGNIELNTFRFHQISEWSIPSLNLFWLGGKSMVYAEINGTVYGFIVKDDILYMTRSLYGSTLADRDDISNLRAVAENQTTPHSLKLSPEFRQPGYSSVGVKELRISDIEIQNDKFVIVLENDAKSKHPVTFNIPEMTLREAGKEF